MTTDQGGDRGTKNPTGVAGTKVPGRAEKGEKPRWHQLLDRPRWSYRPGGSGQSCGRHSRAELANTMLKLKGSAEKTMQAGHKDREVQTGISQLTL